MTTEPITVQCYAGYKADERPTSFLTTTGRRNIDEVIDRWYDPDANYFRVRADGGIYLLRHDLDSDHWELVLSDEEPGE